MDNESADISVDQVLEDWEVRKKKLKEAVDEYLKFKKQILSTFLGDFITGGLLISGVIFIIDYFNPEGLSKLFIGCILILFGFCIWLTIFINRFFKMKSVYNRGMSLPSTALRDPESLDKYLGVLLEALDKKMEISKKKET